MIVFKPPQQIDLSLDIDLSIFLAGTIDMGESDDWQQKFEDDLIMCSHKIALYNPRREKWDPSWKQNSENPQFYQQVNWELDAIKKADVIVMNLLATSKSPITLLELGLFAESGKLLVCCPDEFYRSGNVQIVCNNYNIPLFKNMDLLTDYVITEMK